MFGVVVWAGVVRGRAGGWTGWGECEAAPLPSIASFVCPMSHSACKPVAASVVGQRLDGPADIARIGDLVRAESLDLLQADHTLSGIDMALWDLLGRKEGAPVWRLGTGLTAGPSPRGGRRGGPGATGRTGTAAEQAGGPGPRAGYGWAGPGRGRT